MAAGVSAGLAGAALLGCSSDEGGAAGGGGTVASRIRVRAQAGGLPAEASASGLTLGVLNSQVGADALDPLTRSLVYSRLFDYDPRSASVVASLSTEVEVVEPLLLRVRLREDVYFHPTAAGEAYPLTADAILRNFEEHRAEGVFVFSEVIDSVEAPGRADLLLRLRAPFSLLFEHLARVDASIWGDGVYGAVPARLGTGPFFPLQRDGDDLMLQASPLRQESERPLLSQLTVRRVDQAGDLDALFVQGQIDVREHPDVLSRQTAHRRRDRLELARPQQSMRALALSLLAPVGNVSSTTLAFRDARVRRALSLALNRTALGFIDGAVTSGPIGPAFSGDALPQVELDAHPLYQHNAEEATALLSAAGYEGLSLRLSHPDSPQMLQVCRRIAEQLQAAGVNALLVTRPAAEFQTSFLAGDFEAACVELDRLVSPDIGLRLHTTGGLDGQRSPWGYSNPVFDAKVTETLSQIDPESRARHAKEAQRMLLDDVPALLPINAPLEYASLAPRVHGYEFDAYDFNSTSRAWQWRGIAIDERESAG